MAHERDKELQAKGSLVASRSQDESLQVLLLFLESNQVFESGVSHFIRRRLNLQQTFSMLRARPRI